MADYRKLMPERLIQIQHRVLAAIGDLGQAALAGDHPTIMDSYAIGVAAALEKSAADIRATVARAEAEGQVNG